MPISIRNPRVEQIARDLARQRNSTMTDVIVQALEREQAETDTKHLRDVNRELSSRLLAKAKKPKPALSKQERDAMWGHE